MPGRVDADVQGLNVVGNSSFRVNGGCPLGVLHRQVADFNKLSEHLYLPNQATRQTENRLYTQRRVKNTTIKSHVIMMPRIFSVEVHAMPGTGDGR